LHKHHLIIRVGAGLIQFVYGSHSRMAADLTLDKNLFSLPFSWAFQLANRIQSKNLAHRACCLISHELKPHETRFPKTVQFWKCDISSVSERAFLGVYGNRFGCSTPPRGGVLANKNSFASCERCRHSVESRTLTCPFKQSNLSAWSRRVTQTMSTKALLWNASLKSFSPPMNW